MKEPGWFDGRQDLDLDRRITIELLDDDEATIATVGAPKAIEEPAPVAAETASTRRTRGSFSVTAPSRASPMAPPADGSAVGRTTATS